jgi:hypothetical protein
MGVRITSQKSWKWDTVGLVASESAKEEAKGGFSVTRGFDPVGSDQSDMTEEI